jgi:DNA polymerase-3 subunit delta'
LDIYSFFSTAVKNNRVSHAYILRGAADQGLAAARHMAMAVNCTADGGRPCGRCNACRKIIGHNHPDVTLIQASAGTIGIDVVRQLQKDIYIKPYEGKKRVYIVHQGDKMTVQAQNCLLKVLEEPPGSGMIIITAKEGQDLLPTVVSRCQTLKVDRPDILQGRQDYRDMMAKVMGQGFIEAVSCIEQALTDENKSIEDFLDYMLITLRDILVTKVVKGTDLVYIKDNDNFITEMASKLSYRKIDRLIDAASKARDDIRHNVNPQLCMEVLLLEIQEE